MTPIRRALLSVSDKRGLIELARGLAALSVELLASGGTARALREAGLEPVAVPEFTGAEEMLGGRVKTLHPRVHGGILARRDDPADQRDIAARGLALIDLVVVNLYPFEAAASGGAPDAELIEQIDIGGPTLLRAAAKNHAHVSVLSDPADYPELLSELSAEGGVRSSTRRRLALKAFARTARYEQAIVGELERRARAAEAGEPSPVASVFGELKQALRYGENPHQSAALYAQPGASHGVANATLLGGKALSYNNLLDADGAWAFVSECGPPTACVVKHASPCGACQSEALSDAVEGAFRGDPLSAFGGIVAVNRPFDLASAEAVTQKGRFVEVVIAPGFEAGALARLRKKKNMRILEVKAAPEGSTSLRARAVSGGFLLQQEDQGADPAPAVVTTNAPSEQQLAAVEFAVHCVKHVRSNAIVLLQGRELVGVGGGQPSRVDAVAIAARKAGPRSVGAILASDAFFPFPDGVERAAEAGVSFVIQPGGSRRDAAVTEAADRLGLAMVHSGRRHFKH